MRSPTARRRRRRVTAAVVAIALLAFAATTFAVVRPAQEAPPSSPETDGERAEDEEPLEDLGRPEAAPTTAAIPGYGVMAWRSTQLGPADFELIRSSGARLYRFNLLTTNSDDREANPAADKYDRLIRAGVSRGIEFLPVLLRTRPSTSASGPGQVAEPPETRREWATWRKRVRRYAERYGPGGRFWSENADLPYRPIRAWEVWNEPNLRQFWDRRPVDAREYARLLGETRAALRDVDPRARIVLGGLTSRYDGAAYLSEVLDEVGTCRVDAIGIHPYGPSAGRAMEHLADARRAADRSGARGVALWSTEIGWKVEPRGYSAVGSGDAQARELASFLAETDRRRDELGLGPVFAFSLRDRVDRETGRVTERSGLRDAEDRPRPAWEVWKRTARASAERPLPPARDCRG